MSLGNEGHELIGVAGCQRGESTSANLIGDRFGADPSLIESDRHREIVTPTKQFCFIWASVQQHRITWVQARGDATHEVR